ncbi:MAG: YagK/YfjJ domain-containing protein [Pseudomonadota bacterium]
MFDHRPRRHPQNDKLRLLYDDIFYGYSVGQFKGGPLIENYLERALLTLNTATHINYNTFAFRIELRFPKIMPRLPMHDDNEVLARFLRYLRYELKTAKTKYTTQIRYIWAREQDNSIKPHYHLMILLNKNAFDSLGIFSTDKNGAYSRNNLYHRMMRAWLKAMGFDHDDPRFPKLINVSKNKNTGEFWTDNLHRDDWHAMNEAMFMASYLCKAYTKTIGQGMHVFDASRV